MARARTRELKQELKQVLESLGGRAGDERVEEVGERRGEGGDGKVELPKEVRGVLNR